MTERRKPLTAAPSGALGECPHLPQLCVHVQVPGRRSEITACRDCGLVKHAGAPWREPDKAESDAVIARLYAVPHGGSPTAERPSADASQPWPRASGGPALETTINLFAVGMSDKGVRIMNPALPGWMDRQQALNLVAWLSVLAELEDAEILAARRQVEAT